MKVRILSEMGNIGVDTTKKDTELDPPNSDTTNPTTELPEPKSNILFFLSFHLFLKFQWEENFSVWALVSQFFI